MQLCRYLNSLRAWASPVRLLKCLYHCIYLKKQSFLLPSSYFKQNVEACLTTHKTIWLQRPLSSPMLHISVFSTYSGSRWGTYFALWLVCLRSCLLYKVSWLNPFSAWGDVDPHHKKHPKDPNYRIFWAGAFQLCCWISYYLWEVMKYLLWQREGKGGWCFLPWSQHSQGRCRFYCPAIFYIWKQDTFHQYCITHQAHIKDKSLSCLK